jgi:hypothetical protein
MLESAYVLINRVSNNALFAGAVLVAALSSGGVIAGGGAGSGIKGGSPDGMRGDGQMAQLNGGEAVRRSSGADLKLEAQGCMRLNEQDGAKHVVRDHAAVRPQAQDRL